jgi:hypothetical protein
MFPIFARIFKDSGSGSFSLSGAKKSHQRLNGDTVCNKTIDGFMTDLLSASPDMHFLKSELSLE